MEVKAGYKQTDLGVIPVDWDVGTFDRFFDVTAGGDFDPKRSASDQDEKHCYPIYSNALTDRGLYGYCSYADHQAGSITITARGTLGCANFRDHPFTAIGRVLVLQPKNEIAGGFFAEVINNRVKFAIESTGVPQLTAPQISNYRLPVPPLPEQRAIAEALRNVDALINSLDRLITKKRDLKQGAMQELLTPPSAREQADRSSGQAGKRRLPGFGGEWEVKKLRDECELITKGTTPTSLGKAFTSTGINFIKIETLEENGCIIKEKMGFIDQETHDLLRRSQLQEKDVLVSIAGALGRVALIAADLLPANTNQALAIVRLRSSSKIDHRFLLSYLNSSTIKKHIEAINVQAAQANLSLENVGDFVISCPSLPEQTAIADVLSDMDAEILALEQKRDKTIALKQGMMQELLTGRIRLI